MPGRRRTGSSPSTTSMSRAVQPASPLPLAATFSAARPFGSAAAKRSLVLAFAADFMDLGMGLHVFDAGEGRRIGCSDYATDRSKNVTPYRPVPAERAARARLRRTERHELSVAIWKPLWL